MPTEIPVSVSKKKIAPITKRYQDGEYRDVETTKDGVKRVALCGLDGSHNRDYRVHFASDPVVVIHAESAGFTHDQLRDKLLKSGLWMDGLRPVEVPTGVSGWLKGFASTASASGRFDWFKERVATASVDDAPLRENPNAVNAYL